MPDQHLCGVAAPFQPPRRQPAVLDRGNGTRSLLRLGAAAQGANGTRPGRGAGPKWFFVYNHLHTVHAIASCNAAEVAMGMLMEATVPRTHR
jgi:hypothetical protein